MKDLTIMRDNFNKLIDYYEKNDITILQLDHYCKDVSYLSEEERKKGSCRRQARKASAAGYEDGSADPGAEKSGHRPHGMR